MRSRRIIHPTICMRISLVNAASSQTYAGQQRSILRGCVNVGVCHAHSIIWYALGHAQAALQFCVPPKEENAMQSPGFDSESERYMTDHMNADHADSNLMY